MANFSHHPLREGSAKGAAYPHLPETVPDALTRHPEQGLTSLDGEQLPEIPYD